MPYDNFLNSEIEGGDNDWYGLNTLNSLLNERIYIAIIYEICVV